MEFLQIWDTALKSRYEFEAQKGQKNFIGALNFFYPGPATLSTTVGSRLKPIDVENFMQPRSWFPFELTNEEALHEYTLT